MSLPGLTQAEWAGLMQGMVLGEYGLLLGAGASRSSTNAMGEALPGGAALGVELAQRYNIPISPGTSLRIIYDLADTIARRQGLELPRTFLTRRFSGCSVPAWYSSIVSRPWRIIWNLNIDDVLENAYQHEFAAQALQKFRSVDWDARHVFYKEPANSVTAVHLHGRAKKQNLVFGSLEYLAAVSHGGAGHHLFWDDWATTPTIVLGASLNDELDMAAPLAEPRLEVEDRPCVVVLPSFSELDNLRLTTAGLKPVTATAEQFLAAVADSWSTAVRAVDESSLAQAEGITPDRLYFLRHFHPLSRREDRQHDFFAGHAPTFADVVSNRDAPRDLAPLRAEPLVLLPERHLTILAFEGSLSGTSTAELRFIRQCELAGLHCYEFDGEAAFSAKAIIRCAMRDPLLMLRIPDLDDYPDAINALAQGAHDANITLRIVTSVRLSRVDLLHQPFADVVQVSVPDKLNDREVRNVIATLEDHHRLSVLAGMSPNEQYDFFVREHGRSLIDSLAALSRGRGFFERIQSDYLQLVKSPELGLVKAVLLTAELHYTLPLGFLARVLKSGTMDLANLLRTHPIDRLLHVRHGLVQPRYGSLAARLSAEQLTRDDRYGVSRGIALALADYISPSAITARTRYARVAGQLLDASRIHAWFGRDKGEEWYEDLHEQYKWNSRYWEQRALAECEDERPRYEMAEAWAREAVARHRDPYSLNTLSVVLLRRATSGHLLDEDTFAAGLSKATEAREALQRPSEHPYVTALSYIRRAYPLAAGNKTLRQSLRKMFNNWSDDARHSSSWTLPRGKEAIDRQIQQFIRESVDQDVVDDPPGLLSDRRGTPKP